MDNKTKVFVFGGILAAAVAGYYFYHKIKSSANSRTNKAPELLVTTATTTESKGLSLLISNTGNENTTNTGNSTNPATWTMGQTVVLNKEELAV